MEEALIEQTALVEETAPAPTLDPIPMDLAVWEEVQLALEDLDQGRPAPRLVVASDTDAETLMARIKAIRLETALAAAPVDALLGSKRAQVDALAKVVSSLQAEIRTIEEERADAVEVFQRAESFYRPSLDAYLLAKIAAKPDGDKSLVTPYGKLLSKDPGQKWSFGDDKALGLWAKQYFPATVKEEPVVNKAELKKAVKDWTIEGGLVLHPETKDPIPGVTVTTPPREITLEVTL